MWIYKITCVCISRYRNGDQTLSKCIYMFTAKSPPVVFLDLFMQIDMSIIINQSCVFIIAWTVTQISSPFFARLCMIRRSAESTPKEVLKALHFYIYFWFGNLEFWITNVSWWEKYKYWPPSSKQIVDIACGSLRPHGRMLNKNHKHWTANSWRAWSAARGCPTAWLAALAPHQQNAFSAHRERKREK